MLLFSHRISPRLQYVCNFIFTQQLGIRYSVTIDKEEYIRYQGPKIAYADANFLAGKHFHIQAHQLLFEKDIKVQKIEIETRNNLPCFFLNDSLPLGFDIMAAIFYLISRYEEYLPHEKDDYGRYPHKESLAFRNGFLNRPLVNEWIQMLTSTLQEYFPDLKPAQPAFRHLPTYDIDMAFAYKGKGILRNLGGLLNRPEWNRIRVICGISKDPFDSFDWMDRLHRHYDLTPSYFILAAEKKGEFDKNIKPSSSLMQKLIRRLSAKNEIGIHPSWQSNFETELLQEEKKKLEKLSKVKIKISRQHYIRMNLPDTYRNLIAAGITKEHSMGYGTVNGFRASFAGSFYWYDLANEKTTELQIFPFCFMEANCYYEQKQDPKAALTELQYYYDICRRFNGLFISIFHNQFLGTHPDFTGWREMYERFISQAR